MAFEFVVINDKEEVILAMKFDFWAEIFFESFNTWDHYTPDRGDGCIVWFDMYEFQEGLWKIHAVLGGFIEDTPNGHLAPIELSKHFVFLDSIHEYLMRSSDSQIAVVFQ